MNLFAHLFLMNQQIWLAATYSTNEVNRYSRYEILGALDSNLTENDLTKCPL